MFSDTSDYANVYTYLLMGVAKLAMFDQNRHVDVLKCAVPCVNNLHVLHSLVFAQTAFENQLDLPVVLTFSINIAYRTIWSFKRPNVYFL